MKGLLTIFFMHLFDFVEVTTITPDIVVKFIAGSHGSQSRSWNLSQWVKVQVVNPMQDYPRPEEKAEYPGGHAVPNSADFANLRHDELQYTSIHRAKFM